MFLFCSFRMKRLKGKGSVHPEGSGRAGDGNACSSAEPKDGEEGEGGRLETLTDPRTAVPSQVQQWT